MNTRVWLIGVLVALLGCSSSQGIVEPVDTDTVPLPERLEWAVPVGEDWAAPMPLMVEVSPGGDATILANLRLGEPDSSSQSDLGLQLVKYDGQGNRLSNRKIADGKLLVQGVDTRGENMVVAGLFEGAVTIGGEGEGNKVDLDSVEGSAFVAQYTLAGELVWVRTVSGDHESAFGEVVITEDNHILVVGYFGAGAGWNNGEAIVANLQGIDGDVSVHSAGDADLLLAKYTMNGELVWAKTAGGTGYDHAWSLAVSPQGHFFVGGIFGGLLSDLDGSNPAGGDALFGEGSGATQLVATGQSDAFVARYGSNGELDWVFPVEYAADARSPIVRLEPGGDLWISGTANALQAVTFHGMDGVKQGIETGGGYLARVTADGVVETLKSPSFGEYAYTMRVGAFEVLEDGSMVVGASFTGEPIFGPGELNQTLTPFEQDFMTDTWEFQSACVARYNPDGSLNWISFGRSTDLEVRVSGLKASPQGSLFAAGTWSIPCSDTGFCWDPSDVTFGYGEPNETTLVGEFWYPGFLAKYVL